MARTTITLDTKLLHRARALAAERGISLDGLIDEAVREHLKDRGFVLPTFGDPNGKAKVDILNREELEALLDDDDRPNDWP